MPADDPAATDSLDEESSRIIEEFESAWSHGRPDVAQHFSRHSRRPTRLLFELAAIDFENRLERGEAVEAADYTSRFPELAADRRAIRNLSRRAERLADEAAAHAPTSALPGDIRDRGIVGAEPDASRPAVTPRQDSLVGNRIGGVSIVRVIAEGGMGRVYEGRQDKPRRPVAVKIIKPGLVSPSLLKRFDYEAQVLGRLRHPGVAQIHTVGTHDVGGQPVPYFVMEYVPNAKTLTQYANDNRLSTHDRLELFRRVCEAVAHGHQKGVIHRDLKPGNILVDASGQPKVIDFGVARSTDSDMALTSMQTDIGALVGTLQYMSPEQFDADPSDLDVRLDVYALGVVLYELLTGKPPYDVRQRAIHEIARVVRERDPTPLSTLDKTLRRDVAIIAGKCLQKDRNRRYSSATELAGDVGRYLAGEPITAAPPGFFDAVTRVARRHKAAAAAVAGIALSLVAAVVGISAFAIRAERARDDASTQRDLADREREAATRARDAEKQRADELKQVSDFQSRMLRQIDTTAAGRGLMEDIRQRFVTALEKAGVPADERATRVATLGDLLDRVNATDTAAALIDRTLLHPAIATIDARFTNDPRTDASLRMSLADVYESVGMYDAALPLVQKALEKRRESLGDDHPDTIHSIRGVGTLLRELGRLSEAEPYLREAVDKSRSVLGDEHRDTLTSTDALGRWFLEQGRLAEAETVFRETLEKSRRVLGQEHPSTLGRMNSLGNLLHTQGKLAEAEPYRREALEQGRRAWGEEHPETLRLITNMGTLLEGQRRFAEAEPFHREALEKSRLVLGDRHPTTLNSINRMGSLLLLQGKFAEAEPLVRETFTARRRVLGQEHPQTVISMYSMGLLFHGQGRLADAEEMFAEGLRICRRIFPPEHPKTARFLTQHADMLRLLGRSKEAEEEIGEAIGIYRNHPDYAPQESQHAQSVLAEIRRAAKPATDD